MRLRTLLLTALVATLPQAATAAPLILDGTAPDSARVHRLMTQADEALGAGRLKEARKFYRTLIDEQRAGDQYAGEALWRLASSHFFADDLRSAADVLDELAAAASRFGDPAMELRATFESAVLRQRLRQSSAASAKLPRIKELLQSPAISEAQKKDTELRMVKG